MNLCKKAFHKYSQVIFRGLIAVFLVVAVILSSSASFSDDTGLIKGKVFIDLNENGKPEDSEPGVKNVLITDGRSLIRTDEKGFFKFQSAKSRYIWLSLPPDLKAKERYFYPIESQPINYNFAVVKADRQVNQEKTLIFMADLHLRDEHFIKENLQKVAEKINHLKPEAIFMLGDLVHEAYSDEPMEAERKFSLINPFRQKLSAPSHCLVGNNDVFGWRRSGLIEGDHPLYGKKMFEKYFGPRYYSINAAGFHIIALDDIQGKQLPQKKEYLGWIEKSQLKWLQEDLKNVSQDTHIIILTHIPLLSSINSFFAIANPDIIDNIWYFQGRIASSLFVANFDQLSVLLKPFKKITFIAGHLHIFEKGSFKGKDRTINFFVCGSVCGSYWAGNMKSLMPLTTIFSPGMMVVTCKNGEFIKIQYETFNFYNEY